MQTLQVDAWTTRVLYKVNISHWRTRQTHDQPENCHESGLLLVSVRLGRGEPAENSLECSYKAEVVVLRSADEASTLGMVEGQIDTIKSVV